MNKDNLTNLVCRNLAFAVAHQIRQIDRLRQIRIDYGQRWIDNSDYSKLIQEVGSEKMLDLTLLLATLYQLIPGLKNAPRKIALEDIWAIGRDALAGRSMVDLSQKERDSLVRKFIPRLFSTAHKQARDLAARQQIIDTLVRSPARTRYIQTATLILPESTQRQRSEQITESFLAKFEEMFGPHRREAQALIINEIVGLASFERGLEMLGVSDLNRLQDLAGDLSYEQVMLISLLEAAPPGRIVGIQKTGYKGVQFNVRFLDEAGTSEKSRLRIKNFRPEVAQLFEQWSVIAAADPATYHNVLRWVRNQIEEEVQGSRSKADSTYHAHAYVAAQRGKPTPAPINSKYLFRASGLLQEAQKKGVDTEACFANKVFWDTLRSEYLDMLTMIEIFGLIGKVPEMLLVKEPLVSHVLLTDSALVIHDPDTGQTESVPYSPDSRAMILRGVRSKMRSRVDAVANRHMSAGLLSVILAKFRRREEAEKNPEHITRRGSLRKSLRGVYPFDIQTDLRSPLQTGQYELLVEAVTSFPPQALGFIKRIVQPKLTAHFIYSAEYAVETVKSLDYGYAFSWEKELDYLVVEKWAQGLLKASSPHLRQEALRLLQLGIARNKWIYGLSAEQQTDYGKLYGLEENAGLSLSLARNFAQGLVTFLADPSMDNPLIHLAEEKAFYAQLLASRKLLPA
ncbi:hypothetical protein ACFL37_00405 [Candidatus Margulisiibacteriota bacterium]